MALPAIWALSGYIMALYLAGFRGVPEELREAARMDGASEFRVYRHVVFPYLRPVTLSAVIILGHISIKVFDLIVAIGGKQLITQTPAVYMWILIYDAQRLREGRRDRDAAADRDLGADRPVPHLHRALGAERMTSTAATRSRSRPPGASARRASHGRARITKYVLLLVFVVIVLMPVYVLLVTSFKGAAETDPSQAWSAAARLDSRRLARRRGRPVARVSATASSS